MAVAEPVVRRASSAGLTTVGGTVVRQIVNRATGTPEDTRAA